MSLIAVKWQAKLLEHCLIVSCLGYFRDSRKCHQAVQEHFSETRKFETEDGTSSMPRPAQPLYSSTLAQTWSVWFSVPCETEQTDKLGRGVCRHEVWSLLLRGGDSRLGPDGIRTPQIQTGLPHWSPSRQAGALCILQYSFGHCFVPSDSLHDQWHPLSFPSEPSIFSLTFLWHTQIEWHCLE